MSDKQKLVTIGWMIFYSVCAFGVGRTMAGAGSEGGVYTVIWAASAFGAGVSGFMAANRILND